LSEPILNNGALGPLDAHVLAQCAVIKDWLAQQAPKEVFSSSELGGDRRFQWREFLA
jgi:hypothetical protein